MSKYIIRYYDWQKLLTSFKDDNYIDDNSDDEYIITSAFRTYGHVLENKYYLLTDNKKESKSNYHKLIFLFDEGCFNTTTSIWDILEETYLGTFTNKNEIKQLNQFVSFISQCKTNLVHTFNVAVLRRLFEKEKHKHEKNKK